MPQRIYTYRLGIVEATSAGVFPLFTTSDGQHVIVRDLVATNASGAAGTFTFSINRGGGLTAYLWSVTGVEPSNTVHLDLRQELRLDELLQVSSDTTSWTAIATGYVFAL